MTILVLSDSHGNVENMVRAVELTDPRMILHLGDCWNDGVRLHDRFPAIEFHQVPGNCDFRPGEEAEKLLMTADKRILMCHGHTRAVKQSLMAAGYAAEEQAADLFLFGHTHRPFVDWRGKCLFVNPGSIGDRLRPSYALARIESGQVRADLHALY